MPPPASWCERREQWHTAWLVTGGTLKTIHTIPYMHVHYIFKSDDNVGDSAKKYTEDFAFIHCEGTSSGSTGNY